MRAEVVERCEQCKETVERLRDRSRVDVASVYRHFFFQAEDGIRDYKVTGVQTCALPICFDIEVGMSSLNGCGELIQFLFVDNSFFFALLFGGILRKVSSQQKPVRAAIADRKSVV